MWASPRGAFPDFRNMPPRDAAQLQRALNAPPRPEIFECDACAVCLGGPCQRWRQRQREWVEAWGGRPPPAQGSWGEWWKAQKAQHAKLLAAAQAGHAAPAAQPAPASAGKRRAQPDGTPNLGGQRKTKNAPAVRESAEGIVALPSIPIIASRARAVST